MKIPKKISPDSIKDSVVEIRYSSKIPFEVAIGFFYKSLDDTYNYTNRPIGIGKQQLTNSIPSNLQQIGIQIANRHLFYNEKIKIELLPNSIIFNCLDSYISWDIYQPEIEKTLSQITKAEIIENYTRVGLRYISEYPNLDLKDCLKFSFSFNMPEMKSKTYTFHSEFNQDNLKIILNLNNNIQIINSKSASQNELGISSVSNVDIDVIMENIEEKSLESLLSKIEIVHQKEKEIFFNLLTDKFLESLNPVY